ncbi:F0F1 ATP synthase subunit delta [Nakamurella antarctica]|uniref:ATP synthase subunit delta n=1 Tax=Nakamurella antarctica TaxID=1902245 RepID=A0A3G8ZUI7_9ACTN|nr:F0F1 ATP synthase subunit delta [Nakamurella antarctica]AZI58154.1 F0F1 ATP synthase subunit delta [Nakamurella antarctica]
MRHLASRQSLSKASDALLSNAATLDDTGLGALGQDLSAVAGALSKAPSLRRTLSDNTTAADAKSGIVAQLFGGKVGSAAAKVLDVVARSEWSTGGDLAEALYQLGRIALFLRAERSGELDAIEDEIFRFGRIVDASPNLSAVLDDPLAQPADRAALVARLLEGKAHPLSVALLTELARDPRGRSFNSGIGELVTQAAARKDKLVAVVTSAVELNLEQRNRLTAGLVRVYGRPVAAHVVVDPQIQGGLVVRVGDEVIDGSVAGRLTALRSKLAG